LARLSITLTEKAYEIYQKIKSHDRSKFVSDAIIEKWIFGTEHGQHIRDMEARVERLERIIEGR
jgi:hypothetical protein